MEKIELIRDKNGYINIKFSNEASKLGISSSAHDSIDGALDLIIKLKKEPDRIIVCGSLYLAGDILNQNQGFSVKQRS